MIARVERNPYSLPSFLASFPLKEIFFGDEALRVNPPEVF